MSVWALHAGYKAAGEQRLAMFMCLACLSVSWWSLWSLSVNAAAVAKGQTAWWRLRGAGWHRLGGLQETEEDQMKETAVYKWQACIAHCLPLREGLVRSLNSFKAPEPAAMHKETQTSSFSHTHTDTNTRMAVPVCCSMLERLHWDTVCFCACLSQTGMMIVGSKCSGSEDLWEQPSWYREMLQNRWIVSVHSACSFSIILSFHCAYKQKHC